MSKGGEKGESAGAKGGSVADYYSAVAGGGASVSESKAAGGKSTSGGAAAAPTASAPSASRATPASADVGKGGVAMGAKTGGEGSSGLPTIGAPSIGRSATMDGSSIGRGLSVAKDAPTVMGGDRTTSWTGFGPVMGSPSARQAQDSSMSALRSGLMPTTARAAETMSMDRHSAIQNALATIRGAEGGYKSVGYTSAYGRPTRDDLTSMTLAEILAFQEEMDGTAGKKPNHREDRTYLGAYQFGRSTLSEAIGRTGLDLSTKFSPRVQEQLAIDLVDNRARQATRNGVIDADVLADRLADEWAGLANSSGKSAYDGRAGNKASVTYSTVRDLARALVDTGAVQPATDGRVSTPSVTLPNAGPIPATAPSERPSGLLPSNVVWEQDRRGLAVLAPPSGSPWDNLSQPAQEALSRLAGMREQVALTAGARTDAENRAAKGTKDSEHKTGNAWDVSLRGMTDAEKSLVVEQALMSGATRVGTYTVTDPTHAPVLHVDFKPTDSEKPVALFDMSSRNIDKAPGWFTTGLTQVTSPQPTARPENTAAASPGFGRFMGTDPATAERKDRDLGPVTVAKGQDAKMPDAPAFAGRSRGAGGPMSLNELADADAARGFVRPENRVATAPEADRVAPKANDPESQEHRDRRADRIDRALPWVAGPVAGAINDKRAQEGKRTFGDWLSDILDGKDVGVSAPAPSVGGEGTSTVTPISTGTPTTSKAPTGGTGAWLQAILEEPARPTPREKWGRGLMPAAQSFAGQTK